MRIGITCYPTFGGSGVLASELGRQLSKTHDVHFICYARPFRLEGTDIPFHKVDVLAYPLFKFPPYTLALASKMLEVVQEETLDILHVHYAVPHSTSAYLAKKLLKDSIKVVTTLHGTDVQLVGLDPSYYSITKFSIEQADGVSAVSESLKNSTKERFNIEKDIQVIYNFVDPARYWTEDHEKKVVTHMSNFRHIKRIPDVIDAFCKISSLVPANLYLVGDGPDLPLAEEMVKKCKIQDKTTFFGNVCSIEEILARTDIFLLPSGQESFGLAALEAMASSVPVIATNVGGLPEFIDHGENGFLCPLGDTQAMAEYAVELLRDENYRKEVGKKARRKVEKWFTPEIIVPQYEAFYESVLTA
ncbi:MAG: N-acetyl-alpha-D-glucosaminyl L-malate synthase BshA [Theionarchaea archaeon]|nr:N-acetyl-alpha-D-glucosaminyl L-malate synthase BshA [Theionarchaea archaeon]MBU7037548.1 N-acetyl-alpha-D-glucosaminyl L-malate synthase BshA [Theionarchaea archaeon]